MMSLCHGSVILNILLGSICFSAARGEATPAMENEPGGFEKALHPGKVDLLYRHLTATEEIASTDSFGPRHFGAAGASSPLRTGIPFIMAAAISRPLVPWPEAGDLILGGLIVDSGDRRDYELQGEYRLPGGLGMGAGIADTALSATMSFSARLPIGTRSVHGATF